MVKLSSAYISVVKNQQCSYGGSQLWSENAVMKRCGCGVIAAADLLIYLARSRVSCNKGPAGGFCDKKVIDHESYETFTASLRRTYLPLLPPAGMTGISLALGLNVYFTRWKLPLHARWAVKQQKLWESMEKMLENDIPVIFAVGPNFPLVWENHRLNFYFKTGGSYVKANSAKAHFITLTGIDRDWLEISSWGRRYFINRNEFTQYVQHHSLNYLSSMLLIEEKK